MIQLAQSDLPATALRWLREWQEAVDIEPDFPAQVEKAKKHFSSKNIRRNRTFQEVKKSLKRIQGDLIRCAYCEDSVADEVEHIFPKNLYPNRVFLWENYTYACGPCNGPKSNHFAIFLSSDGSELDITPPHANSRPDDWVPTPPPLGSPLLINPREENPLNFLWLDLPGTFRIDPIIDLPMADLRRAEYTEDLLALNRDFLLRARENAYYALLSVLEAYADEKEGANRTDFLEQRKDTILNFSHRTVWVEMIRQKDLHPELFSLFERVPEAISWEL